MGRPRKVIDPKKPVISKYDRDKSDCHHLPYLDSWIGVRAVITTTKGICRGRLEYMDGWYFCQSGQILVNGQWKYYANRFLFRKGEFKKIEKAQGEDSSGR